MNKEIALAKVKATLSECIRKVEKGLSVLIKRHGKPLAALVRPQHFNNLERFNKAGPEGGLASLAGGWEGSEELAYILNSTVRFGQRVEGRLE
jgi:prevent-host-death family protein